MMAGGSKKLTREQFASLLKVANTNAVLGAFQPSTTRSQFRSAARAVFGGYHCREFGRQSSKVKPTRSVTW
jgi:hypothetical protein